LDGVNFLKKYHHGAHLRLNQSRQTADQGACHIQSRDTQEMARPEIPHFFAML
jgi:hypothetical protein